MATKTARGNNICIRRCCNRLTPRNDGQRISGLSTLGLRRGNHDEHVSEHCQLVLLLSNLANALSIIVLKYFVAL